MKLYEDALDFLMEDSTEDAKKTLEAIIGTLKKSDGDESKDMLKMAQGMMDYYKDNKSFSPDQAKWIYNTSKALFKEDVNINSKASLNETMDFTKIAKLTDSNNHIEAYLLGAKLLKHKTLEKVFSALKTIVDVERGYNVGEGLDKFIYAKYKELMKYAKMKLDDESYKEFQSSF